MKNLPLTVVRVSALTVIAITPWLYGGTLGWVIDLISNIMLIVSASALIAWALSGHWPHLGWLLPLTLVLLGLGWCAALNPMAAFDEMLMLIFPFEVSAWRRWIPGTVDGELSTLAMKKITGLIGLLWIIRDMSASFSWRRTVIWTLALTGCSVAAHGVLQKTGGDVWGYWDGRQLPQTVFAGFWYHGNAAAFLNLTWPFVAALSLESFARRRNQLKRALLVAGTLLMISAVLVNVSKAGHLLFVCVATLMAGLTLPVFLKTITGKEEVWRPLMICFLLIVLVSGGLAVSFGLDRTLTRWSEMDSSRWLNDSRYECARFCLGEMPRAGFTGFGPGTFEAVFLDVGTTHPDKVPEKRWRYAHQDSLQTLLEWGWLGGSLWIVLGLGGLFSCFQIMRKLRQPLFSSRYVYHAATFTSLTSVALHAQLDFPLQVLGIQVIAAAVLGLGISSPSRSLSV